MSNTEQKRWTIRRLKQLYRAGEPIVALTAYDYPFARIVDAAGVHLILVGDSLGMTMLGYENTIPVTMAEMLHHTAAVARGVENALVVGDMPFMTYRISPEQAMSNAARFLQEGGAQAVKLEGGREIAPTIARLVEAGIPVLGHVGLLPQSILADGGYRVHGRTEEDADKLREDAVRIADAGAFAIVLEEIPAALGAKITEAVHVPTLGIGAGSGCSGQIQVLHDILGLFEDFTPRHTKRYAELGRDAAAAVTRYVSEVGDGTFPNREQAFQ